ncbi:hypothetical protein [Xanthobacter sediminis]
MGGMATRSARNVGEGWGNALSSLGGALAARGYNDAADTAEAAGQKSANDLVQQFYRQITGTDAPPASGGTAPAGVSIQPQAGEGAVPGLAETRSRYAQELQDPAVAARLAGLIQAEVGGQGPQAQQAFAESLTNRAAARNQSLSDAMGGSYWPASTQQRTAQFASPQQAQRYQQILAAVMGGSNVSQFATGNASGNVGFNGGPQTFAAGGERFGIEGPDQAWARRMQGGMGTQVASTDPSFAPGLPAGADPLPPRPGAMPAGPQPAAAPQMPAAAPQAPQPAPQQMAQAPQQGGMNGPINPQRLAQIMSNPWVPAEMKQMMLQQFQIQQKQQSPEYQADLAYKKAQTEALQRKASGQNADYGLTPQYGVDQDGNPVLLQMGTNGTVRQPQMPPGVSLSKQPIKLDAGTHYVLLDPITRQPVGQIPKNLAGAEAAKVEGKAQGAAAVSLPQTIAQGEQMLATIQGIKDDPYRAQGTGMSSVFNMIPGTGGFDFGQKVAQLKGQTFLEAFDRLRGGGQITEVEGQKAENAIARLNVAQSEEAFLQALTDLQDVVQKGMERARSAAGAPGGVAPTASPPAQPGQPAGPSSVTDKAAYDALPSGAEFIAPDGSRRRKP